MPIWRAFYGGVKDVVELSFLDLFELFLARVQAIQKLKLILEGEIFGSSEVSTVNHQLLQRLPFNTRGIDVS
jgi:hypothetical protein